MTCFAVVDTNVLVAALLSDKKDSATVQVVGSLLTGEIIPVYSKEIVAEYREVLHRKKFGFSEDTVEYLLAAIDKFGVLVEPSATGMILPDMRDLPFYEVVMEKRDEEAYLVTGNLKHFPKEPFIVTARQMMDILNGKVAEC